MSSRRRFMPLALAALGFCSLLRAQQGGREHVVAISEDGPFMQLAQAIPDHFGWDISYEEPPWESQRDVAPYPGGRSGKNGRLLIQRGKAFTLRFQEPGDLTDASTRRAVIDSVLKQFFGAGNSPFFQARHDGAYTHIVPGAYVGSDAKIVEFQPLLDTRISIPRGKRTVGETVSLVLAAVSRARSANIVMATIPMNAFYSSIDSVIFSEGNNERARDIMIRAFEDQNGARMMSMGLQIKFSWILSYEPTAKTYYFNCRVRSGPRQVSRPAWGNQVP